MSDGLVSRSSLFFLKASELSSRYRCYGPPGEESHPYV